MFQTPWKMFTITLEYVYTCEDVNERAGICLRTPGGPFNAAPIWSHVGYDPYIYSKYIKYSKDVRRGDAVLGLCSRGSRFFTWSPGPERLPAPSDWPLGLAYWVEGSVQPWSWPPQVGPGRTRSLRGEAFRASGSCLPEY